MILPAGHDDMTDAELAAALIEAGYDEAGAAAVVAMLRENPAPRPLPE